MKIPFNKPYIPSETSERVEDSQEIISRFKQLGYQTNMVLVNSATSALEIMAMALNLGKGDEVIMPSFTYAATANAFARTGAKIVFVDIEPSTLNLDPSKVSVAITPKTKAIIPIHYGGIAADMEALMHIGRTWKIPILEDAAHGVDAYYKGIPLGTLGMMGCLSFHQTKNISCGRGGLLFINEKQVESIVEETVYQGTDRLAFMEGKVSEYTWQRLGGEFSIHPYSIPVLSQALDALKSITQNRVNHWKAYYRGLKPLENKELIRLANVPRDASPNGHIFYLHTQRRDALVKYLEKKGIQAYSHYEPLHLSNMGVQVGRAADGLNETIRTAQQIIRLPMYYGLQQEEIDYVIESIYDFFK